MLVVLLFGGGIVVVVMAVVFAAASIVSAVVALARVCCIWYGNSRVKENPACIGRVFSPATIYVELVFRFCRVSFCGIARPTSLVFTVVFMQFVCVSVDRNITERSPERNLIVGPSD